MVTILIPSDEITRRRARPNLRVGNDSDRPDGSAGSPALQTSDGSDGDERFENAIKVTPVTEVTKREKKRILVVDDRERDTRLVKICLEMTNDYEVREENDARAALSVAEKFQPQLILLDIMMPGIDGGGLAACFQANPKLCSVPIVFLTALVTKSEVAAGGGRLGDYPFLAKPIDPSELIACLRNQLGE
jgi:CheY-like chemotaxis protein